MRFTDVLGRSERSELSQMESAELLGISERTFRRWRDHHREAGLSGLAGRRLAPSLQQAPVAEIARMMGLYRDPYRGFTVKHFHEQLGKRHGYTLGYTVTKLHLHRAGLVQAAAKRSAHRKKRPRRPMVGMLLHQDASTHAWFIGNARKYDLVVTLDDATSAIYSAFLADEEGTASSLRGVREVVARHRMFCSLYSDRGSHYFETPVAGGGVSKTLLTQVGRALKQLGIDHIAAYSPQDEWRGSSAWLARPGGSAGWVAGWLGGWVAGWLGGWVAGWLGGWPGPSSRNGMQGGSQTDGTHVKGRAGPDRGRAPGPPSPAAWPIRGRCV